MKGISPLKKHKAIKLFLSGYTYDEIVLELGIAKGGLLCSTQSKTTPNQRQASMVEYPIMQGLLDQSRRRLLRS